MRWTLVPSPVDDLLIAADEQGLCTLGFGGKSGDAPRDLPGAERVGVEDDPTLRSAAAQLAEYFDGRLTEFTVPLSVSRGSEFERAVWAELARIPYGQTRTYGQVAALAVDSVSDPGAASAVPARAVGVACNRNPLAIVVPCHRVVGAGRKLVGFGGGLDRKRYLLELEANVDLQHALA
jgi:methylated-DNA-[protein]-cysteine S-methyltransferase